MEELNINELKQDIEELKEIYLKLKEKEENIKDTYTVNNIKNIYIKTYSTNRIWLVFKGYDLYELKDWILDNNIVHKVMLYGNEVAFPLESFDD